LKFNAPFAEWERTPQAGENKKHNSNLLPLPGNFAMLLPLFILYTKKSGELS